ncbi:MAG: ABC transporter ATP-binding protein [Nitrospinota bacterium]|nr:MAG: ABC transporter ATP-binding protein [Nitrospinota bacterium]
MLRWLVNGRAVAEAPVYFGDLSTDSALAELTHHVEATTLAVPGVLPEGAEVSFQVEENELIGIIGPNGSGKTTLLNLISGVYTPDQGEIWYRGRRIDGLPAYTVAALGIGRTFQVTKVFRRMSVLENLLVPALASPRAPTYAQAMEQALEVATFLRLVHLKDEYARNLSGGQQKLLELGKVLMLNPDLIMLDEPFAGVHPQLKEELHRYIRALHGSGKTFLIISHDMHSIFGLSQRLLVLSGGEKIVEGDPERVKEDERVIEAYLGEEE